MATNKTGSRGQLRTTPPTAMTLFYFESLIFPPSLLRMQLSTEPPSSEGAMDAPKALQSVMINRKDYYGCNCNPHFWFRMGYLWKCEHVRMVFFAGVSPPGALPAPKGEWCFPTGRAISAEGGVAVHLGEAKWSCPD